MKRRILTFAGRKKTLEILYPQLKREYEKKEFEEWYLLENTRTKEDLKYIEKLEKKEDFITIKRLSESYKKMMKEIYAKIYETKKNIKHKSITYTPHLLNHRLFWHNNYYSDEDVIYIKLDDDIIFIEEGSLTKLINFKLKHPKYLFVYGNIINNTYINCIYDELNIYKFKKSPFEKKKDGTKIINCFNYTWKDGKTSEEIHRFFIQKVKEKRTKDFYFPNQKVNKNTRFSINVMCWFGKDFKKYYDQKSCNYFENEEEFISVGMSQKAGLDKGICGDALFSHFSYEYQNEYLLKTNILEEYKKAIFSNF